MIWLTGCFLVIFLYFKTRKKESGFRESLVLSYIGCNVLIYASTYLFSMTRSLAAPEILFFWIISFAILVLSFSKSILTNYTKILPAFSYTFDRIEIIFLSGIAFFCLISLISVIYAAPYSVDGLIYHLSSVMHWIQNKSIALYPTNIARQLVYPPFSSFVQLHLFLLNGNDHWANCPQFIAMLFSLAGLSLLCPHIGLTRKETLCAVLLAAALPIGILQASSPLNDYVVSFWVISFIAFSYKYLNTKNIFYLAIFSVSFAFIFLTKVNGLIIAMPFLIYFLILGTSPKSIIKNLLIFFGLFLIFALPLICRMAAVYPLFKTPYANSPFMNFAFSYPKWNFLENIFRHIFTEATYAKNNEMTMSNPLYFLCAVYGGICLALKYNRIPPLVRAYALLLFSGFLLLCFLSKASMWVGRFDLPVLILFCPLMALALRKINPFYTAALLLLLCFSAFTVLDYAGRPPFDHKNRTLAQKDQQFKRHFYPDGFNFYMASLEASFTRCPNIGLLDTGSGNQKEYILWHMMQEKFKSFRIEHMNVENYSRNFAYPLGPFEPCTVILTKLDGNLPPYIPFYRSLRLLKNYGNTGLYVE